MVSGFSADDRDRGLAMGAADYLVKPVDRDRLAGILAAYRTGAGPHTGVHLIIVSDDLSTIIHRHPPMQPGGRFQQQVELRQFIGSQSKAFQHGNCCGRKLLLCIVREQRNEE